MERLQRFGMSLLLLLLCVATIKALVQQQLFPRQARVGSSWLTPLRVSTPNKDPVSRNEARISRYSPEKRRLRPAANLSSNTSSHFKLESNVVGSSSLAQPSSKPDSDIPSTPRAKSNKERKYEGSYRSSFALSSILMLARRKENPDAIVMKLSALVSKIKTMRPSTPPTPTNSSSSSLYINRVKRNEYNLLIKELGDNGHLKQCEEVLALMRSDGVRPCIVTYSTLVSKAGIWQKVELAEKYFMQMVESGIVLDVPAYNCLANAYAKGGKPDSAFNLVGEMKSRQLRPNVITFNTLIDSCAHSGDVSRARSVLDTMMKEHNILPNARTYSSFIHICCQAKEMDEALQVLAKMKEENFELTDITLSLVAHGLGKCGELQSAFDVLETMKSMGLRPNVVTMSSLVDACGKFGQLDRAFVLYNEMSANSDRSQQPNSITCSSLIDACLKSGEVDRAFTVIQDMRVRQLPMTQVTYTSVIAELTKLRKIDRLLEMVGDPYLGGLANSASALGSAVFKVEAEAEAAPTAAAGSDNSRIPQFAMPGEGSAADSKEKAVINSRDLKLDQFATCLVVAGHPEKAAKLRRIQAEAEKVEVCLVSMEESQVITLPTNENLAVMQASADYLGSMEIAEFLQQVLGLPAQGGFTESMLEEACRFLLSECGKASRFRRISLSLSSSLAWGTDTAAAAAAAAAATSLVVFKEFIGDRKNTYANAVDAYQWIKENKLTPCARIYNQLLRVVNDRSKKGSASEDNTQWQQKKQLKQDELFRLFLVFQEMRVSGVQIDAATYNTLINACAAAGDLEKAIETVQAMQEEGILPNVITYTSLIKACRYNGAPGCVQLAEYYFAEMQQKNNHFSRYIQPTTYTYLQLMKTHLQAIDNGLFGEGDTRRIWELLEELLKLKLLPTVHIWRECVMTALVDEDIHKALGILERIRSRQLGVDKASWHACIDFCVSRRGVLMKNEDFLRTSIEHQLRSEVRSEISSRL